MCQGGFGKFDDGRIIIPNVWFAMNNVGANILERVIKNACRWL